MVKIEPVSGRQQLDFSPGNPRGRLERFDADSREIAPRLPWSELKRFAVVGKAVEEVQELQAVARAAEDAMAGVPRRELADRQPDAGDILRIVQSYFYPLGWTVARAPDGVVVPINGVRWCLSWQAR